MPATEADQQLPGEILHEIRNTAERYYLLAPRPNTVAICAYFYGYAAERDGRIPHVEMTMMTHRHGESTDAAARRSLFWELYHGLVGRYVNITLGRHGRFWDNRKRKAIILLPEDDTDDETDEEAREPRQYKFPTEFVEYADEHGLDTYDRTLLYILLNPVKANLVDTVRDWPGFKITPDDWGKTIKTKRPPMVPESYPDYTTFTPLPPARWDGKPLAEAQKFYNDHVEALEELYRRKRRLQGKRVLGPRRCKNVKPLNRPGTTDYRKELPRYSGGVERVRRARKANGVWLERYERLSRKFAIGQRNLIFPCGTVQLVQIAGVRCRGAPLPDENPHI
jgi:hypothetical protein